MLVTHSNLGGATFLTEASIPPATIQALGRWSSATFQIYIHKNLVLLHALLFFILFIFYFLSFY
jgi:hypothetical protein